MSEMRWYRDGTWWYDQVQIGRELDLRYSTLRRWRRVFIEDEKLIREVKLRGRIYLALDDVLYVIENHDKLVRAGVRFSSERELERAREYARICQAASWEFATRRGEEYSRAELEEVSRRDVTAFDTAVLHGRTYYGVRYARARGKGGG